MKQKFAEWAKAHDVPVEDGWTVEQICDAIVTRGVEWPPNLVNEEGWQLYTAVLRREVNVQAIAWDELSADEEGEAALEVTCRLQDRREFKTKIARSSLKSTEFGAICRVVEDRLRAWKVKDDAVREAHLAAKDDKEYDGKVPDLMEYVIGFRSWNLSGERIVPIGAGNDVWDGGREVRAQCGKGELHRAPAPDCECGLYAWNDWAAISGDCSASPTKVYGAVQACGRMEVHNEGFRAEYMRPVVFGYDDSDDTVEADEDGKMVRTHGPDYERVQRIVKWLGGDVPVVPFSEVPMKAREFGQMVADNPFLLPEAPKELSEDE